MKIKICTLVLAFIACSLSIASPPQKDGQYVTDLLVSGFKKGASNVYFSGQNFWFQEPINLEGVRFTGFIMEKNEKVNQFDPNTSFHPTQFLQDARSLLEAIRHIVPSVKKEKFTVIRSSVYGFDWVTFDVGAHTYRVRLLQKSAPSQALDDLLE